MKRKALLIGIPGTKDSRWYLSAVYNDINNMKEFLLSNAGGEWNDSEIIGPLINCGSLLVLSYIIQLNVDYSLIYFSGHGGQYKNGRAIIELDDGELDIIQLKSNSPRQLMIIDTCRTYFEKETPSIIKKAMVEQSEYFVPNSRELYDDYISSCEKGIIIMNAASEDQSAGCNKSNSYFTYSLIEAGNDWNNSFGGEEILDVLDTIDKATTIMNRRFITNQKPDIIGGKRMRWFPFAVRNQIIDE